MLGNVLLKWFLATYRLHTTKKISPSPILQIGGVFCIDVDQESLINKKKLKNRLSLLIFCGGCAHLMSLSTYLCKKKKKKKKKKTIFIKNWEIWELFILFLLQQSSTTECWKLAKWTFFILAQSAKNRARNHPQNGFPSDGYEHNLLGKHVFDRS